MAILLFFCFMAGYCANTCAAEVPSLRELCRRAVSDHVCELTDNMTLATIDQTHERVADYLGDAFPELQKNILDHMARTFRVPACLHMSACDSNLLGAVSLSSARGQLAVGRQDRLSLHESATKETLVTYHIAGNVSRVAWSPGGDKLLYVVEQGDRDALFLSDDPRRAQEVFTVDQRIITALAWRPDGSQFIANVGMRLPDPHDELKVFSCGDESVELVATIPMIYVYSAVMPQTSDSVFVASGTKGVQRALIADEPVNMPVFDSKHAFGVDASPDGTKIACYHKDFESDNDFCVNRVAIYDCGKNTMSDPIALEAGGCDAIFIEDNYIAALTSLGDSSYVLVRYDLDGEERGRAQLLGADANYSVACCDGSDYVVLDSTGLRWQIFHKGAESLEHLICKLALAKVNSNSIDDVAALTESKSYQNFLPATQAFLEDLGHSPEYAERRAHVLLDGMGSVLAQGQSTSTIS